MDQATAVWREVIEEARRGTAYHEAGHAVVAYARGVTVGEFGLRSPLDPDWLDRLGFAEIEPLEVTAKTVQLPETQAGAERIAPVILAGGLAECQHLGWEVSAESMREDLALARSWVAHLSMVRPEETTQERFDRWLRTACDLLEQQWLVIERVAADLLEVGTLTGEDLRARYGPMIDELSRQPAP